MHKKIAQIIKQIVDESPYDDFECDIVPSTTGSEGFWKVYIIFKKRNTANTESLLALLPHIGRVYGEGIDIIKHCSKIFEVR